MERLNQSPGVELIQIILKILPSVNFIWVAIEVILTRRLGTILRVLGTALIKVTILLLT